MTLSQCGIFSVLIILNYSSALFSLITKLPSDIFTLLVQIPKHTKLALLKDRTQNYERKNKV